MPPSPKLDQILSQPVIARAAKCANKDLEVVSRPGGFELCKAHTNGVRALSLRYRRVEKGCVLGA